LNDIGKLEEVYREIKEVMSEQAPSELIADSGYYHPEQIERLEKEQGIETYVVPLPERSEGEFIYDEGKDE
jgi:hypothetical protein